MHFLASIYERPLARAVYDNDNEVKAHQVMGLIRFSTDARGIILYKGGRLALHNVKGIV